MTTNRFGSLLTIGFGMATALATGSPLAAQFPPAAPGSDIRVATGPPAAPGMLMVSTAAPTAGIASHHTITPTWVDIKDLTLDRKSEFLAGLRQLQEEVGRQINELRSGRTPMRNDPREWELTMMEMNLARTDLIALSRKAHEAPAEAWDEIKETIGAIWRRSQNAWQRAQGPTQN